MSDASVKLAEAIGGFIGWILCGTFLWLVYSYCAVVVFKNLPAISFPVFFGLYWAFGVVARLIKNHT